MFAPAACAVRPLCQTAPPGGSSAATVSIRAVRCDPGTYHMHPFSTVAASRATQTVIARRSSKDHFGMSKCQAVGLPKGGLKSAWSFQSLTASTPARRAASSRGDGNRLAPAGQLVAVQEVLHREEAVLLVAVDLCLRHCGPHPWPPGG